MGFAERVEWDVGGGRLAGEGRAEAWEEDGSWIGSGMRWIRRTTARRCAPGAPPA